MHWFRRIQLGLVLLAIGAVGVLSLADRAPATVHAVISLVMDHWPFGSGSLRSGMRMDSPLGSDTIGHFVMWGAIGLLAAGIAKTTANRFTVFTALFTLSALFEAGQQYLSWSRSASFSDLLANGVGLIAGYVLYTTIERLVLLRGWPRVRYAADL